MNELAVHRAGTTAVGLALVLLSSALAWGQPSSDRGHVQLTLDRYEQLLAGLSAPDSTAARWAPGDVAISLPAEDFGLVEVEVTAPMEAAEAGWVPLIASDALVRSVTVNGSVAPLAERHGMHALRVPEGGKRLTVKLEYSVSTAVSDGGAAVIPLPALPSSRLELTRNGVRGAVDVSPARLQDPAAVVVRGISPATAALVVRWSGAHGQADIGDATYRLVVEPSGDSVRTEIELSILQGRKGALVPIAAPASAVVSASVGNARVLTRSTDEGTFAVLPKDGPQTVVAVVRSLVDRSDGQPRATLTPSAAITRVEVEVPGQREITFEPKAPSSIAVVGEGEEAITRAEANLPFGTPVHIGWTETRQAPERNERFTVESYQLVRMTEGAVRSEVSLRYEVIRGGVRELQLEVPDDAVVYRVTGPGIEDWRTFAGTDDEPRRLRVTFGPEATGQIALKLDLERVVGTAQGAEVAVPIVKPLGAFRQTGVVALIDGEKVGFAPIETTSFSKVGQDALPSDIRKSLTDVVGQAFKHIGAPGALETQIAEAVPKDVRFDARVLSLYTVEDGALIANATIELDVKSGRADTVLLDLPESASVLSLTVPSLNKSEPAPDVEVGQGRKAHRVALTQGIAGGFSVHIEIEQLMPKGLGRVALPDIRVMGADVQEGSFGVVAETGIEVQAGDAVDLRKADAKDLPNEVRLRSDSDILLGYQYAHVPWSLGLEVKRLETVQTLAAVASPVRIETTVLEDGHVVTAAHYHVANQDRQFLRLTLPEDAQVWAVAADGEPIKTVRDESGALAVPLPKRTEVDLRIVYAQRSDALSLWASLDLSAPEADLLATEVQWRVLLPRDYRIARQSTDLASLEPWETTALDSDGDYASGLPIRIPEPTELQVIAFSVPVSEATEPIAGVSLSLLATPPPAWGDAFGMLAGLLLLFAVAMRFGRGLWTRWSRLALIVGIVLGVATLVGWQVRGDAVITLAVTLAGTAVVARLVRHWRTKMRGMLSDEVAAEESR